MTDVTETDDGIEAAEDSSNWDKTREAMKGGRLSVPSPGKSAYMDVARQFSQPPTAPPKPEEVNGEPKPTDKPSDKPSEKPAELDEIPESVRKTPKAAENFRRILSEREQAKKEAAELKSKLDSEAKRWNDELETVKKSRVEPTEYEATKKKAAEYEELVQRFYVEHDPKFVKAFGERMDQAISDAKDVIGKDKSGDLEEVLRSHPSKARDRAIRDLSSDLDEHDRTRLLLAVDRLTAVQRERSAELSKAKENFQTLKGIESKKQAEQAELEKKKREFGLAKIMEAADTMPKLGDWDDDKDSVQFRKDFVSKVISDGYPIEEQLKLPARAAEAERLTTKVIPGLLKKIEGLEGQIKELTASSPGLSRTLNGNQTERPRDGGGKFTNRTDIFPAKAAYLKATGQ